MREPVEGHTRRPAPCNALAAVALVILRYQSERAIQRIFKRRIIGTVSKFGCEKCEVTHPLELIGSNAYVHRPTQAETRTDVKGLCRRRVDLALRTLVAQNELHEWPIAQLAPSEYRDGDGVAFLVEAPSFETLLSYRRVVHVGGALESDDRITIAQASPMRVDRQETDRAVRVLVVPSKRFTRRRSASVVSAGETRLQRRPPPILIQRYCGWVGSDLPIAISEVYSLVDK